MRLSSTALALALAATSFAAPAKLIPRQINDNGTAAPGSGITDLDILQFALTLEYLELNLYEKGVNMFNDTDFQNAGYGVSARERFEEIIGQEMEHISMLQSTVKMMGDTPTSPCTYSFPITDVYSFLNVTDAVNGLGPSAYLGAGAFITNKLVLTVGSSIGIIEGRHNSWLNGVIGRDEFPTTYQVPLSPTQSYAIASVFIESCPSTNPNLKAVTAYPPSLSVTNKGAPASPLYPGGTIYLAPGANYTAPSSGANVAFLYGFNTTIVPFDASTKSATIPSDTMGQAYAVLTTASQGDTLDDANSLTGPAPFFVDVPASAFLNVNYPENTY